VNALREHISSNFKGLRVIQEKGMQGVGSKVNYIFLRNVWLLFNYTWCNAENRETTQHLTEISTGNLPGGKGRLIGT
jgi:hypothetical protein